MSKATLKYYRAKPLKTRQLAKSISGKRVSEALSFLRLSPRASAKVLEKVVMSALSNATDKGENDDPNILVVESAMVDQGPVLKRHRARARGRMGRVRHKLCHVRIVLSEQS